MSLKKKSDSDKDPAKKPEDLKIRLDSLEMESVEEQLRAIKKAKSKDAK